MMRIIRFSVVVVGLLTTGCASYEPIARLHGENQRNLKRIEVVLTVEKPEATKDILEGRVDERKTRELISSGEDAFAKKLRDDLKAVSAAAAVANGRASLLQDEVKRLYPADQGAREKLLRAGLAKMQTEFNDEIDSMKVRAGAISEMYLKLVGAIRALHRNGEDIQKYLELGFFERLWVDVRGVDAETLKAIGDDLKRLGERVTATRGE